MLNRWGGQSDFGIWMCSTLFYRSAILDVTVKLIYFTVCLLNIYIYVDQRDSAIAMHVAINLLLFTIALLILLSKAIILKFDTGGSIVSVTCESHNLKIWSVKLSWKFHTGGVHLSVSYMCIVQDLERKLIWCAHLHCIPSYFLISWPFHGIGVIEKWWVDSVLWQFWLGGPSAFGIYMFSMCTGISLYFLISWPFQMGTHWCHWKA